MKALDEKPVFWIAYVAVAAVALAIAWRLLPFAIPLVNLDITMTRTAAVAKAQALAAQRTLAPDGARTAVAFNHDVVTQNYVELEGGGKPAFAQLVAGKAYAPYWWDVRLFKAGSIDEALIRFRPDGALDGFTRRVAETYVRDPATKALTADEALALARARAAQDWNVDFAPYRLLDQSQETRPTGRVDHRFVFEREEKIGEARIRLQLAVVGDELMQVNPFVHVPESFQRRFQELRSANNTIAGIASIAAGVLYGLAGCVLGALWLLRRHWLLWKPPLAAGLVIGALLAATILANAPAAWFGFSTTQDEGTFWARQAGVALLAFVGGGLLLGEVFMAAEGLSRRAFPHHPQLWSLWSRAAGGTREVAGRTAGGYLFVPIELAFVAVFYFVTNQWLGWWQPSEALTDPNILASYVPALTPISISLQAGFMEECVFRAVPLAGGALIGARFGHRGLGIAIAFILQAVIFGAAHANYPGLPSYSRLVELAIPSMLWALIFLRYGLLPTILLHALFDLALISIPLFLIDAPGAWLQRGLVIAAGLAPALVVCVRRVQAGAWGTLPATLWNRAWQPAIPAPAPAEALPAAGVVDRRAALMQRVAPGAGTRGPCRLDRVHAACCRRAAARDRSDRGRSRGGRRRCAARLRTGTGVASILGPATGDRRRDAAAMACLRVARGGSRRLPKADRQRTRAAALGRPLRALRRQRRRPCRGMARHGGGRWARQAGRASPAGRSARGAPGSRSRSGACRARAARALSLDVGALELRSADQSQLPARRDWTFAWADPRVDVGKGGEARAQVAVAGDEVVIAGRSMFVPEAWRRAESEREGRRQVVKLSSIVAIALAAIAALVYAVIAWSRGRSDRRAFLWAGGLSIGDGGGRQRQQLAGACIRAADGGAGRQPARGQRTWLARRRAGHRAAVRAPGGVGGWYARSQTPVRLAGGIPAWALGVGAALATAGIAAALTALVPASMPLWPDARLHSPAWPWAAAATSGLTVIPATVVTLFLLCVIDRVTSGWTRRMPVAALALVAFGVAAALVSGRETGQALLQGAVEGLIALAFAWLVLRFDLRAVPAFVATGMVMDHARSAILDGTGPAWALFALATAVTVVVAWAAMRYVARPLPAAAKQTAR